MPPEIDCEKKKHISLSEKFTICNCYKEFAALHFYITFLKFSTFWIDFLHLLFNKRLFDNCF
jgi:hypothetical protein